jgi:hypothetical protein
VEDGNCSPPAVALAKKMARIAWAMMMSGETYRHQPVADAVSA